jgi:hypothetical protein
MHEYSYLGISLPPDVFLHSLVLVVLQRIVCRKYYKKTSQYIPPDPYDYYVLTPTNKGGKIGT